MASRSINDDNSSCKSLLSFCEICLMFSPFDQINRALEYLLSGKTLIPLETNKTGHFSEENWGDYKQITLRDGKDYRKQVKRATVFAKTIESLNNKRWKAIIDSAAVYVGKKDPEKVYDRARVNTVPILEDDDSDGDIIWDAMFDDPPAHSEPHSFETPQASTSESSAVLHTDTTAE
ncbi:hypothetical protein EST38_g14477 [Candolleomyces aberdarensis]|uniref:Uncharacterized protein n=1 Tax=Candolleomyces aberdarensis TaxID=2316362 RepID=A0A4V1Q1F2_9AGAR|nr:hypothetical protein EST38_g14477 [Candolleomyces aberdarensis]